MGKISEALDNGKIKGNASYECGKDDIVVNIKEVVEVEKWNEDHLELDVNGFFLFEVEEDWIYAGLVKDRNIMTKIFKGKRAIDIFKRILKEKLISTMDHAAYVGYELGKAEECLRKGERYVQN